MKRIAIRLSVVGVSFFLSLLAAEFALSLILGAAGETKRYLYYSEIPWIAEEWNGGFFLRHPKNTTVRTFARYGDTIDYENTFTTNEYGFREGGCPSGDRRVVPIIGNSFTHGTGNTTSWVGALNSEIANEGFCLFNAGVGGTGFTHWKSLAAYLRQTFSAKSFVVLFITDDLYRPNWRPRELGDQLLMCVDESCTPVDIFTREDAGVGESASQVEANLLKRVTKKGFPTIFALVARVADKLGRDDDDQAAAFRVALSGLAQSDTTRFLVLRTPMRDEVHAPRNENPRPKALPPNVRYEEINCHQNVSSEFHPNDEHPNDRGYARIKECVRDAVLKHRNWLLD